MVWWSNSHLICLSIQNFVLWWWSNEWIYMESTENNHVPQGINLFAFNTSTQTVCVHHLGPDWNISRAILPWKLAQTFMVPWGRSYCMVIPTTFIEPHQQVKTHLFVLFSEIYEYLAHNFAQTSMVLRQCILTALVIASSATMRQTLIINNK